ncbi:MAG: aminotransferase class III-fold pyridoxal phosphate-dependent enzyme [Gammaproteobacteria bacterium]
MAGSDEKRYAASRDWLAKVEALIPGGTQTFSKGPLLFPRGRAPHFLQQGRGGRVRDIDGNEYVDVMAALLAVILGYRDPDVDAAIRSQLQHGISFSLATQLEGELAERLIDIIPCADMVRFGKNGSDATAAAVRVARAATGRERVITTGYHGWQDWYIGATTRHKGVPECVRGLTHRAPFNDLEAMRGLFDQYPDEIAAVMIEPVHTEEPRTGYLQGLRDLTREQGAVLVFDEIITACRIHTGGAQAHYGVTPDLTCLGKALGNGMPLSVIAGRRELMREFDDIFISGTFGGEALSLAAALAVLEKMQCEPVIDTLWRSGRRLREGLQRSITGHGIDNVMAIAGLPPMQSLTFRDHAHASRQAVQTLYAVSMLEQGVLTTGAFNLMYAHDNADIDGVLAAFDRTCARIAEEIAQPGLADRLGCPLIQPVFRVRE